jgi:ABC-type transport system involved in multi-copper enzyme maturation permease subunit
MTALHAPAIQTPVTLAPSSLARLVQVELRKAVDTRAGRWLLVVIALVALGTAILTAVTGEAGDRNLPHVLGDASQLASILLPVLGVLLVTSEWSQHTALTTFTLVPRRSRIIAAKVAAGVLLAAAATVVCIAVAAVVLIAVDHGRAGLWEGAGRAIGYVFVLQILNLLLGVGFGLLFRNTPVAIVMYFVIPTAWSILTGAVSALAATGRWLDPSTAWNHLASAGTVTPTSWAQIATAAAVWIVVPVLAGGWLVLNRPVDA